MSGSMNEEAAVEIRRRLLGPNSTSTEGIDPEVLFYAENLLIEDHLEGSLTDAESELFLRNFLVTEERRDQLREIKLLKRYSSGSYRFDASDIEGQSHGTSTTALATLILIGVLLAILIILAYQILR